LHNHNDEKRPNSNLPICQFARQKALSAIALVEASVNRVKPYQVDKQYTPQELEPYDALSHQFVKAVETSIKFFHVCLRNIPMPSCTGCELDSQLPTELAGIFR
jgi:hypothetical protein